MLMNVVSIVNLLVFLVAGAAVLYFLLPRKAKYNVGTILKLKNSGTPVFVQVVDKRNYDYTYSFWHEGGLYDKKTMPARYFHEIFELVSQKPTLSVVK